MEKYKQSLLNSEFYILINRVLFVAILLNFIIFKNINFFLASEIILLLLLVYEDEKNQEISIEILISLLLNRIFLNIGLGLEFKFHIILFAFFLYFGIYILSRKSIGLGDLVVNTILAIGFQSIKSFYIFFTLTFAFGALYSSIKILTKNLTIKSSIAFVKFIVLAYFACLIWRFI